MDIFVAIHVMNPTIINMLVCCRSRHIDKLDKRDEKKKLRCYGKDISF